MNLSWRRRGLALSLAVVAACGSSVDENTAGMGSGGGKTSTGSGGAASSPECQSVCAAELACVSPTDCTFANIADAVSGCAQACDTAFAGLNASDAAQVRACLACDAQAANGKCVDALPAGACDSPCKAPGVEAAEQVWSKAWIAIVASSPAVLCTNGMNGFGSGSCSLGSSFGGVGGGGGGGGDEGVTCQTGCGNGNTSSTVSASCTAPSEIAAASCLCTAGKDTGKMFQVPNCDELGTINIWNECNL